MIDLHCHTTASDGSESPTEFIKQAKIAGIHTAAITDHDTVEGILEAKAEGAKLGVRVIPGIELAAEVKFGRMHILGYHIDPNSLSLNFALFELREARKLRMAKIVQTLQQRGYKINLEEVNEVVGGAVPGRPHLALVLVKCGYALTIKEVMNSGILSDEAIEKIPRKRLSPKECLEAICNAGGIPVLAHPYQTKLDYHEIKQLAYKLKPLGLAGIETAYPEHSESMTQAYRSIAKDIGLIETGGSDWHGKNKPHIQLGIGKGDLQVPEKFLTELDKVKAAKRV